MYLITGCKSFTTQSISPQHFTLLWDVIGIVTQLSSWYHLSSSHYLIYYLCCLVLNEVNSSQTAAFTPKASYFLLSTFFGPPECFYASCTVLYTVMGFMNYKPLWRSKTVSQLPLETVNENAAKETSAHWAHVHAVLEHLTKISLALHTRNSCKMLMEKSLFRVQLERAFLA